MPAFSASWPSSFLRPETGASSCGSVLLSQISLISCSAPSLLHPAKESSLLLRCCYDLTGFPQIIQDISLDFSLWSITLVMSSQVLEIRTQISLGDHSFYTKKGGAQSLEISGSKLLYKNNRRGSSVMLKI